MNMEIRKYAAQSSIPRRVLLYLNRKGIIGDPLSVEDQAGLLFLEKVWGDKAILRAQLNRLSLKARMNFINTADLPSKWERYAFSRFYNLEPGKKLPMSALIEEIQITFRFLLSRQRISRLYKIRNRVQVVRHREKKRGDDEGNSLLQSTNK